jgi:hypothetical protein
VQAALINRGKQSRNQESLEPGGYKKKTSDSNILYDQKKKKLSQEIKPSK